MPFLPYSTTKPLHSIKEIIRALQTSSISNVLIITDMQIRSFSLTIPLEEQLEHYKISYTIFDGTNPNPTIKNIEEARTLYLKNKCQAIIALGGGSSIDCAKVVGARIARPRKKAKKMKGLFKILRKTPLLIAVPTTAGTGSETTLTAVITDEDTHYKYPINDFFLIPDYAALIPEITFSLPPHLTATTGMDALTHAIEAYIGQSTTKETEEYSQKAIELIFENIEKAYHNGNDLKARSKMLYASYLAGIAFSKSYVGYVHAVAHSLGGKYGIPHGLANAVLLPHVLKAYREKATVKLAQLSYKTNLCPNTCPPQKAAKRFICHIERLNKNMNIPKKLKGISPKDIPQLAKQADKEANPLYPVPVLWDAKELEHLYHLVM